MRCLCLLAATLAGWFVSISLGQVARSDDAQLEALEERAFREAIAIAAPSIVRIETIGGLDVVGKMLVSSGPTTGVVIAEDGWIITSSFNFASKPASIIAITEDGQRYPAEVIASDQARMLTLLKIDASGLTPLTPVPQSELAVGQWSIALGRTYDQPFPNISVGIISALGRIWGRAVQTDAKISPANYGGPLVDIQGRGIGVLVPLSPEETGETAGVEWYDSGIGFAVPLDDIYAVLDRLKEGEDLKPGLMGVGFPDRSPVSGAAEVDRVRPGSPADDAGLQVGDTIIAADGQPVARVPHLRHILGRKYAGEELAIKVKRDDATVDLSVTLAAELTAYKRPLLGILPGRPAVSDEESAGVAVRFVLPESPAAQAKIERGDRIVRVNDQSVTTNDELADAVGHFRAGDVLAVALVRDGEPKEVEVTLVAMAGDLPESIPTVAVPEPEAADIEDTKTGRFVETLGGDAERGYWAYVPDGYNPAYEYGLVVWLHPPGDTMESDVLKAWKVHCERRGLILLGPKTSRPSGWSPADVDFVQDLVDEFGERYTIDPSRIVLHATGGGAEMAAVTAFRQRKTFRGLSLVESSLRIPPPDADPDSPLQFHFVTGNASANEEPIREIAERLREMGFPVTSTSDMEAETATENRTAIDQIAVWIDALDRI